MTARLTTLVFIAVALCATGCPAGGSDAGATTDTTVADSGPAPDAGTDSGGADSGPPPLDISCVGTQWWAAPMGMATLAGTVSDPTDPLTGVPDVTLDLFDATDVGLATVLSTATTMADGSYSLGFDPGMMGLEATVRATSMNPAFREAFNYTTVPLTVDVMNQGLVIASDATFGAFYLLVGAVEDPGLGTVGASIVDCNGNPVPGATLELSTTDPATQVVYLSSGLPNPALTATDASGAVAVFNAPVGPVTLTATVDLGGGAPPEPIYSITIEARTGVLTVLIGWPN